jgi:hypothetical protein
MACTGYGFARLCATLIGQELYAKTCLVKRTLQSRFDKSGKKICKIKALKVAHVVRVEPVSIPNSLLTGKITGNLSIAGADRSSVVVIPPNI